MPKLFRVSKSVTLAELFYFSGGIINRFLSRRAPSKAFALLEGCLFVLFASGGIILVKLALADVGPFMLAALRFFLGFLLLLPFLTRDLKAVQALKPKQWGQLLLIGLSAYTVGNAIGFWGLEFLPASTAAFLMSFSPVLTLIAGALWLKEFPGKIQLLGVSVLLAGSALFFSGGIEAGQLQGLGLISISLVSMVFFWLLSRKLARENAIKTLPLTALPLALGGGLLFFIALPLEGVVPMPPIFWLWLMLMVVFSTSLSFMLYNHALQTLTAFEMNTLISTVPLLTALMAFLFLNESLSLMQWLGMLIAVCGVVLVQSKR